MTTKKTANRIKEKTYHRGLVIDAARLEMEARTVPASLSSETVVKRFFGTEKLSHADGAINLERAQDGLPLLLNHNQDKLVGRAHNIRVDNGKLRGDLTLSRSALGSEALQDIEDGILKDVSLAYRIEKYKDVRGGIVATRWQPFEVSLAAVPADHTVGINRTMENEPMPENEPTTEQTLTQTVGSHHTLGVDAGRKLEQQRTQEIRGIFARFLDNEMASALLERCLSDFTVTPDKARAELLGLLSQGYEPTATPAAAAQHRTVDTGETATEKLYRGIEESLTVRAMLEDDIKVIERVQSSEFFDMPLVELARRHLEAEGATTRGMNRNSFVGMSLARAGGHSTSDFPSLLANVANKAVAKGYDEQQETWQTWATKGSVSDFKKTNLITLSEFSDLDDVSEGGEYTEGTYKDKHEEIGVKTKGKLFYITREAIINDDIGMLNKIPRGMGVAAKRTVGNLAYAVLTGNQVLLEDGKTVFHADHNNIGTAGAMSETTLDESRIKMQNQKGLLAGATTAKQKASGAVLNIQPGFLVVPTTLRAAAQRLMTAEFSLDAAAAYMTPSIIQGMCQVVSDPRLDAVSTAAWYVLATKAFDTIEVAFLNGNDRPYTERENEFNRDVIAYKVRIDVGAGWVDYRGAVYNAGA